MAYWLDGTQNHDQQVATQKTPKQSHEDPSLVTTRILAPYTVAPAIKKESTRTFTKIWHHPDGKKD